jgi:hypothetical protein
MAVTAVGEVLNDAVDPADDDAARLELLRRVRQFCLRRRREV